MLSFSWMSQFEESENWKVDVTIEIFDFLTEYEEQKFYVANIFITKHNSNIVKLICLIPKHD